MSDNKSDMTMKRIVIFAALVLVMLASPLVRAESQSLDAAALDAIRTSCVNAQVNLQRLQQSDK